MFGRSSGARFTTSASCAVNHHTKTPTFNEEIKIAVPLPLTERHHLFFAFYHVSVVHDSSKKSQVETPIGYSWLPLVIQGQELDDKVYDLMVAQATVYADNKILPPGYSQYFAAGVY